MKTIAIATPVTVQILTAPPAPESKATAKIREREAVLDEDAARPTRGARDVVEEIVAECAVLDNYATPARAIAAMRSLADQDGPAQAPWRYVVPAGPDILQLYLDYGKLIDATTMRARTNQIADRARRIWQLVAPHVALPPP